MRRVKAQADWVAPLGALSLGALSVLMAFALRTGGHSDAGTDNTPPMTGALTRANTEFVARLLSNHSQLCMDTADYTQSNGQLPVQRACSDWTLQRFRFEEVPGSDAFRISRSYDGKCLEANSDASSANRVRFWTCHQGDTARPSVSSQAQLWQLSAAGGNNYRLVSQSSNAALVIQGANTNSGAQLTLRTQTGSSDELWQFDRRVNANTDPATVGQWGPLISWPFVPVHAAVLPDNRLLAWSSNELDTFIQNGNAGTTHSAVYNVETGQFNDTVQTAHDMFCAGTVQMADGRIMAAGGNPQLRDTSIFDPATSTWQSAPDMLQERWYGTAVTLSDGDVLATFAKGADNSPERYSPNGGWSALPGASMATLNQEQNAANQASQSAVMAMQWYAFMHAAPDGRVFHSGPTPSLTWFDTDGVGATDTTGLTLTRNRQFGSSVMYRPGELLISGGADPTRADTTSEYGDALGGTSTVIAVDLNGSTPLMTSIDSLSDARVNHNSVVMPNGEVLVTGGESWGRVFSDRFAVTTSEIWNPDTGEWRAADSISSPRTYHSWAVLLEDARVMTGGGGLCGDCGVNHRSAQVFTPAYLLNSDGSDAVRPEIGSVASTLFAGERLVASVQNAPSDLRFSLVRFSSVTHSINTDQRWIPVDSTEIESGLHSVELPVNPNVLIPGRYWLFAYSRDGAPSVGHPVLIEAGSRTSDSVPILPQSASIEVRSDADSDLSISAFEPDGQSLLFSVDNLPPGLQLDRATGRLSGRVEVDSWTPSGVTVTDGTNTVSGTVSWRIVRGTKVVYTAGSVGGAVWLLCAFAVWRRCSRAAASAVMQKNRGFIARMADTGGRSRGDSR